MSTPKMKGFLKSFRYISQMFENEKQQEMQIGFPTDVKHVAHIGWDGPSVNSPSWMNEFKTPSAFSSAPLSLGGSINNIEPDNSVKWVSEDSSRRGSRSAISQGRDLPELPKATRRQSTGGISESPTKEKSDKPRQSRRSSKPRDSSDGSRQTRIPMPTDGRESPARDLPDIPKKSRRKKSKDASGSGSSKSRFKPNSSDPNLDRESPSGCISKSSKERRPFEEDGQGEKGNSGIS